MNNFKERFKTVIKALGKQKEISENLNINYDSFTRYVRGAISPPTEVLLKLCKEYRVNANWLLTGSGEMFRRDSEITCLTDILTNIEPDSELERLILNINQEPLVVGGLLKEIWIAHANNNQDYYFKQRGLRQVRQVKQPKREEQNKKDIN